MGGMNTSPWSAACSIVAILLLWPMEALAQPHPVAPPQASSSFGDELSDESRALYKRGLQKLRENEPAAAIESFDRVIERHPKFEDGYLSRAQAYRKLEAMATTVEDRDRAAMSYLGDEQAVKDLRNRGLRALDSLFTKRTLAITAIYLVAWALVLYMWWYSGGSPLGAVAVYAAVNGLGWVIVPSDLRVGLGVVGLVLLLVVAYVKQRQTRRQERAYEDSQLELQLRKIESVTNTTNPSSYTITLKACPTCSREVGETARVCPRCNHRFVQSVQ